MRDFIFLPGLAINPAAITAIRYNDTDLTVNISIGNDVLFLTDASAKYFLDARPKSHEKTVKDAKAEKE